MSADPALCAGCHNGQAFPEVGYTGYTPQESGLKFQHANHPKLGCQTCHGVPGGEGDMAVQAASGDTCLACHGNGATDHFEVGVNPCETCHYDPAPGHTPDFQTQHATAAAAELPNCYAVPQGDVLRRLSRRTEESRHAISSGELRDAPQRGVVGCPNGVRRVPLARGLLS